jgi:hypothetical protein
MKWDKRLREELENLKPVTDEEFEELLNDRPRRKRKRR